MTDRIVHVDVLHAILNSARVLTCVEALKVSEQIRSVLFIDLEEHIFEVRHANTVGRYIELFKTSIEILEEATKVGSLSLWNDERNFLLNLHALLDTLEVRLEEFLKAWVALSSLLHKSNTVPDTETVLQKERAANALDLALNHDANSVTKNVSLVHVVSRQNDDAVFFVCLEHVPEIAASTQVHT